LRSTSAIWRLSPAVSLAVAPATSTSLAKEGTRAPPNRRAPPDLNKDDQAAFRSDLSAAATGTTLPRSPVKNQAVAKSLGRAIGARAGDQAAVDDVDDDAGPRNPPRRWRRSACLRPYPLFLSPRDAVDAEMDALHHALVVSPARWRRSSSICTWFSGSM
jgi:hypothetical protein